jgi:ABC-type uncharacterized transport system substrate-binding protein
LVFRHCRKLALGALLLLGTAGTAAAHPHVWLTIKSEVVYAPDGSFTAVRHVWTFDEMFSAFATQGLDKNGDGKLSREELQELAEVNVSSLKEFDYFTVAKVGDKPVVFDAPTDYWLEHGGGQLTLHFTLPVKAGTAAKGAVALDVYDPTYFIAFSFADGDAVKLVGAPACKLEVQRSGASNVASQGLSESFFNGLTAGSNFGAQFANRIVVHCP